MATNPPKKPPEYETPSEHCGASSSSNNSSTFLKQRRSNCSCSNISIMQLFHEMKQKFPTVPDHVVSDVVTANCHNRPACIDSLEKAVLGTPAAVQAYPSQSIHSTSLKRRINERKLSKLESSFSGGSSGSSSRESSVDKSTKCVGEPNIASGNNFVIASNNTTTTPSGNNTSTPRDSCSVNNPDKPSASACFDNTSNNRIVLSRPNTLAFSGPRPTRVAPLPPISSTITASPELGETVNVQLNVTVSPVANRSPLGQRHTSTLQLQPEPPFSRELAQASSSFNTPTGPLPPGANSRSSTSVNLTLRQPSDSPQSPIHIHASPLKYTAKGFNAQSGIQSKLEITFRDGFGSISAMRTHMPGYDPALTASAAGTSNNLTNNNNHHSSSSGSSSSLQHGDSQSHEDNPYRDLQQQFQMARFLPSISTNTSALSGTQLAANKESDGLSREELHQNYLTEVALTQQIDQKNRMSEEVQRYRQQLDGILREIYVLERQLSRADAEALNREVQLLEEEVDQMQKEVDSIEQMDSNQNPAAGITDGLNALSIEGSPVLPAGPILNRPPRPPRPPPPKISPNQQPTAPPAASISYTTEGRLHSRSISAPVEAVAGPSSNSVTSTGEQWTCSLCTFQNHELMTRCEVCSLPKMPGRLSSQNSVPAPSAAHSLLSPPLSPPSSASPSLANAPVESTILLQSPPPSSSSADSSAASTPQAQPTAPSIQNASYQKSSIEC